MSDDLAARLRGLGTHATCVAADRIEAQAAEIARLRSNLQQHREQHVADHARRLSQYGVKAGALVSRWQTAPPAYRSDEWCQLDDAIVDALHQGGVYAWAGDGVGMVRNIVEASVRTALATARREGMAAMAEKIAVWHEARAEEWDDQENKFKKLKTISSFTSANPGSDGLEFARQCAQAAAFHRQRAAEIRAAAKEGKP